MLGVFKTNIEVPELLIHKSRLFGASQRNFKIKCAWPGETQEHVVWRTQSRSKQVYNCEFKKKRADCLEHARGMKQNCLERRKYKSRLFEGRSLDQTSARTVDTQEQVVRIHKNRLSRGQLCADQYERDQRFENIKRHWTCIKPLWREKSMADNTRDKKWCKKEDNVKIRTDCGVSGPTTRRVDRRRWRLSQATFQVSRRGVWLYLSMAWALNNRVGQPACWLQHVQPVLDLPWRTVPWTRHTSPRLDRRTWLEHTPCDWGSVWTLPCPARPRLLIQYTGPGDLRASFSWEVLKVSADLAGL